ncbi:MAG: diguanylate cyclase [Dehalococcoidales bacterium]|nr:diguanylate cyclase [Dehalococcoidales bacterium]
METIFSGVNGSIDYIRTGAMFLSENTYQEVLTNSALAIITTDTAEKILAWNKYTEMLLEMGPDDLYLRPVGEIFPLEEWQKIKADRIPAKGVYPHLETRVLNKRGETLEADLLVTVITAEDGRFQGYLTVIRDIRESKRTERALKESLELSRGMMDTSATAVFILKDGRFTFANQVMEEISGYSLAELMEINRVDLINPGHREEAVKQVLQVIGDESRDPLEFRIFRKDLETAWVSERLTRVFYQGREQIMGNWMDITEWKVAEEFSRYHSNQTELLLKIGTTVGQTLNLKDIIENSLDSLSQMMQDRPVAFFFLETDSDSLDLISQRNFSDEFVKRMSRIRLGKGFIGRVALTGLSLVLDPTYYDPRFDPVVLERDNLWSLCSVPVFARDRIKGVICVGSRKQQQAPEQETQLFELIASQIGIAIDNALLYEKTVEMAFTDGLTGLYNRRYLLEEMERELSRTEREKSTFSVVSMDIDNLKVVNDRYGHNYGDHLLRGFGEIIKRVSRKSDIAARTGGDEFVIVAPECDQEQAMSLARRLLSEANACKMGIRGEDIRCSVSIGIAGYPVHGATVEEVLGKADKAMYAAKRSGKNRIMTAA